VTHENAAPHGDIKSSDVLDAWLQFATDNKFISKSMLTLTFDRKRFGTVTVDRAMWEWRYLVQRLNQYVGGENYRKKWSHSYFGYIVGIEPHRDGVYHLHAVVDNWISFPLAHQIWNDRCGFAWCRITKEPTVATRYVLKYILKTDLRPTYFFQPRRRVINPETGSIFPVATPDNRAAVKVGVLTERSDTLTADLSGGSSE